jgi:hypothetical protein
MGVHETNARNVEKPSSACASQWNNDQSVQTLLYTYVQYHLKVLFLIDVSSSRHWFLMPILHFYRNMFTYIK